MKKTALILLLACIICTPLFAQNSKAYLFSYFKGNGEDGLHLAFSYDGLSWEALNNDKSFLQPLVGEDKLMRDPCIIAGPDQLFHMVWTVSWKEKGIGYASSKDLVNWSEQQCFRVMEHEPEARNCWAPEIFYDTKSAQYMIFWSTTIPGRFPKTEKKGDRGYNHRMYYVLTKDFQELSKTELLYDQGFNVIDGTLLLENEEYILFLKDETRIPPEKNIRIARSQNLTQGYGTPTVPITGDYWAEGPTVIKIDEYWYVYFDKYRKHRMGAVRSKDLKSWVDVSEKISFPEGTRHGTVFEVSQEILDKLKKM